MLEAIAKLVLRWRKLTLALGAAWLCFAIALLVRRGPMATNELPDPEAESVDSITAEISGVSGETMFVALFEPVRPEQSFEDVSTAMHSVLDPLRADPRIQSMATPDDVPTFIRAHVSNKDKRALVATITLKGSLADALAAYPSVRERIASPDVKTLCTGRLSVLSDMNHTLQRDLVRGELVALPIALLLLVLVFRTLVAASIPVGVGALSVVSGVGVIFGLAHVTNISAYSINVCSLIGLGVAIDYSLFLVSRYREELARGEPTDSAIVRTVGTAGRVVAFSGIAVSAGLAGLLFFRGSYLFPMGLAGIIVVFLAVIAALTAVPAILSLLGSRIHALRIPWWRAERVRPQSTVWAAIARAVMRHPLRFALPVLACLLVLGSPIRRMRLALADVGLLDRTIEARQGYEELSKTLPDVVRNRIVVAVEFPSAPILTTERIDALADFADRIKSMPHVAGVQSVFSADETLGKDELEVYLPNPPPDLERSIESAKRLTLGRRAALFYVLTDGPAYTNEARSLVRELRADRKVGDGRVLVGGQTAREVDAAAYLRARLPAAAGLVVGFTLVLMLVLLRSVVLPIKAAVMNLLSIAGAFGALVWIFQDGHFGLEGRPLNPALPVLLFCVLFGVSMDYEVLILSRVREAYLETRDNAESVARGLERAGGLVTSAAAIMIAVFSAFVLAHVRVAQAIGVGMALAIFIDATLIRVILVPATMRILGKWNWWAPRFLLPANGAVKPLWSPATRPWSPSGARRA